MPQVWDCHIHLFSEAMSRDPVFWGRTHNEATWRACVAPPDRPSLQDWPSVGRLLDDMDAAGVERAILQGWYWENHDSCREHNRFYAQLLKHHSDRLSAFGSIQPQSKTCALEELNWIRDHGFCGIGEIHPQAQGFSLLDKAWSKILEHIQGWDFPVNLHVTDPDSHNHPGKVETPLNDYVVMAQHWPEQSFILAHLGALIPLRRESASQSQALENVYFDCAAIPLLYKSEILQKMVQSVGAGKLLFGTDYPLRVFPKHQKQADFTSSIRFIQETGLSEQQAEAILTSNARALFRA